MKKNSKKAANLPMIIPTLHEDLAFVQEQLDKIEAGRQKLYQLAELAQSIHESYAREMAEWNTGEELKKSNPEPPASHPPQEEPIPTKKSIANRIKQYIINIYKELYYISQGNGDKGRR